MKTDFFAGFRRHPIEKTCDDCDDVTNLESPREISGFLSDGAVTNSIRPFVTGVTEPEGTPPAIAPVTPVTTPSQCGVTGPKRENVKENGGTSLAVTPSHRSHQKNNKERREGRCGAHPARNMAPDSRHPLIPKAVRAKLEALEAQARAQGWPAELLWNAGFWDRPRGLAAVLDAEDEIVEVTSEFIAILKTKRDLLRFRRHVA